LIVEIIGLSLYSKESGVLIDIFSALELAANFCLCVLMVFTTRRTTENPRPDLKEIYDGDLDTSRPSNFLSKMTFNQDQSGYILVEIKMGKRILEVEGKPVFEFTVKIREKNVDVKVLKTYQELRDLEEYIQGEYTHVRYPSFIKKNQKIPKLDRDLNSSTMSNITGSTGGGYSVTMQTEKLFLKKVNNIEKFLKTIAKQKIYHCRQILDFLKIPADVQRELLEERSQYLEMKRPRWQSASSVEQYDQYKNERTYSYVGTDNEIEEERKEEKPMEMQQFKLIDDYIEFDQKDTKRVAFEISIPTFQLSNEGEFYEFVVDVQYKEGDGARWSLLKRYTSFVQLHESLDDYFKRVKERDPSFRVPSLPPQIQKQNAIALN